MGYNFFLGIDRMLENAKSKLLFNFNFQLDKYDVNASQTKKFITFIKEEIKNGEDWEKNSDIELEIKMEISDLIFQQLVEETTHLLNV